MYYNFFLQLEVGYSILGQNQQLYYQFQHSQTMELPKSKKQLYSSKHASSRRQNNKSELIKVYAAHSNIKKNKNKEKSKLNNNKKSRKDTYDYQFPQFSIVFKQNGKSSTFKSCINNQINHSKISECKSSAKMKTQRKSHVYQSSTKTKKQKSYRDISVLHQNFVAEVTKDQKWPLQKLYLKCVQKVFHMLDIFNKGIISEVNINKWVPEPALYFLGKVFQKIRSDRLSINMNIFIEMCSSLFYQTNPEDIQWFIDEMKNIQTLKKSINYQQKHQLSPIQKRALEQQYIKNNQKQTLIYKNRAFENIIGSINMKQTEIKIKIDQVKQKRKSVTFHILQQKHLNCQPKNYQQNPSKRLDKSIINVSNFDENESSATPSKKSILKNSNKTKENQKKSIEDQFKNLQLGSSKIANFTFQLPQTTQTYNNKYQKNDLNRQFQDIYGKYKEKLQQTVQSKDYKPVSARYENNQVSYKPESIIETQRITVEQDNKRLDLLKNRIQGFLKQNAEKIQKNRSFYLQSCMN